MKKMGKMRKSIVVFLAILLFALTFTGCIGKPKIDPVETVQAILDAELKGELDAYVKLSGEKKEDVSKEYEEVLDNFAKGIAEELKVMGASAVSLDDAKELSKKMLASGKYEVQDAEKDKNDNYTVNVAVYPSNLVETAIQSMVKKIIETPLTDTGEIGTIVMESFNEAISNQSYGEAQVFTVRLTHNEDYQYEASEEDLEALGNGLFEIPEELTVASGKDYGNVYLNWLKADWEAASDDEKVKCCLTMIQKIGGFTDEEMAYVNPEDATVQVGVSQMKDGIQEMYESGIDMSIGDFVEYMMSMGLMY